MLLVDQMLVAKEGVAAVANVVESDDAIATKSNNNNSSNGMSTSNSSSSCAGEINNNEQSLQECGSDINVGNLDDKNHREKEQVMADREEVTRKAVSVDEREQAVDAASEKTSIYCLFKR